jgi:OOP family OmpA-OmpF porin
MKNCSEYPREVCGHTDSHGREEMNQQLSQSRAEAVQTALLVVHAAALNPVSKGCHYVAKDEGT